MTLTNYDKAVWAAGFVGHVALLFVLVRRRRWKEYPVFTAMILFQALVTVLLVLISHQRHRPYLVAYWVTAFLDYAFQIGLIFEMARIVLRPTRSWVRDARSSFLTWAAVGVAVATGLTFSIGESAARGLDLWAVRANLFTSVLTLEVFLSMSAAANKLGLPWRSHVMALGQGVSAVAITNVLADFGHMHYGWDREFIVFDGFSQCVYLATLGYWFYAFLLPERKRAPLSAEMQEYLLALHRRVQYDLEGRNAENSL